MSQSNSHLTQPRPQIFYVRSSRRVVDEKLWTQLFGEEPPVVVQWKEFTAKYMTLGTTERKQLEATLSQDDTSTLSALPLLRRVAATPRKRATDLYDAVRRLVRQYPVGLDADTVFGSYSATKIMQLYSGLLNEHIKRARLVVTVEDGQPVVIVRCSSLREAAFVWASFGGLEVCPGCGRMFAPNPQRENQRFCSVNCGQRIYQREFRKRQKRR